MTSKKQSPSSANSKQKFIKVYNFGPNFIEIYWESTGEADSKIFRTEIRVWRFD
jgi:hypothetical protein